MHTKYILILLALFTGQINSIVNPTSESQLARLLLNKHAGFLPSAFGSKQMATLLQDVKKESHTHGFDEALTIRQMSYLIEEKLNYWQQIKNNSAQYYNRGRYLLLTAALGSALACLYVVYVQHDYANQQAPQELESIKHELQALGAHAIDVGTLVIKLGGQAVVVSAWGPPNKMTEMNGLLKKAGHIHENLYRTELKRKGAVYGSCIAAYVGIKATCSLFQGYYAEFYHQKYSFIRQELQKYQQISDCAG